MVVICWENNYKLDTRHVIDGVVGEGTREGEVTGSNTSNRVAREKCRDFSLAVLLRRPPVKIDFHWRSSVTRLYKWWFLLAPSTGGYEKRHYK
jgi:hypothetical protein